MRLSVLVVSRTAEFLNEFLSSIANATTLEATEVEILCSWNGSNEEQEKIHNSSGYEFLIANRDSYHFATNINALAKKANGEIILIINDDILLDSCSIDEAITCLCNEKEAGLVGARLRNQTGALTHAGIVFDYRNSPYHQLDRLVDSELKNLINQNLVMPAVTGAFMLLKKEIFLELKLNEEYKVCGEDVELCLNIRQKFALKIFYCPRASGIHEMESTRKTSPNQEGNDEDLTRLRMIRSQFLQNANTNQLLDEIYAQSRESSILRSIATGDLPPSQANEIMKNHEKETKNWQAKFHALQLNRLEQEQKLASLTKEISNLKRSKEKEI